MSFAEQVKAAVEMLGGSEDDRVVDFLVDPGAGCRALDATPEHGGIVVRAAPELGPAAQGHGPAPASPLWIRIMRGAREVGTAALREANGMVRRAERIEIESREEPCCDAPTCERKLTLASVWISLEKVAEDGVPSRLLVAEQRTAESEPAVVGAVAARLAAALGVPIQRGGEEVEIAPGDAPDPLGEDLGAPVLGRFALRSEGSVRIVRDWDSVGPRASATRNAWIGAALLVAAAVTWVQLVRAIAGGGGLGATAGTGAAAALLTLAGVAFAGVARFSARYTASSAALVAVGRDRIVVLPWVARDGAVDARPEGRLGAAISLGEVRGAKPRAHREGVAVELDTDHGAIDAMVCPDAASAELWCKVVERVVDEARHPRLGASARQRFRQRAAA